MSHFDISSLTAVNKTSLECWMQELLSAFAGLGMVGGKAKC